MAVGADGWWWHVLVHHWRLVGGCVAVLRGSSQAVGARLPELPPTRKLSHVCKCPPAPSLGGPWPPGLSVVCSGVWRGGWSVVGGGHGHYQGLLSVSPCLVLSGSQLASHSRQTVPLFHFNDNKHIREDRSNFLTNSVILKRKPVSLSFKVRESQMAGVEVKLTELRGSNYKILTLAGHRLLIFQLDVRFQSRNRLIMKFLTRFITWRVMRWSQWIEKPNRESRKWKLWATGLHLVKFDIFRWHLSTYLSILIMFLSGGHSIQESQAESVKFNSIKWGYPALEFLGLSHPHGHPCWCYDCQLKWGCDCKGSWCCEC